ncbi:hypothetical protein [Sphingomonas melonis]|uniref:hypothetical protein n=1 Tax=Sphingomonas melonis TaxID=152682 RepID=UPI000382EAE6|nr:hypothetical protein [Sphingomonas melonis]
MSAALPAHVATDDEPLPPLNDRFYDGPDLKDVISPTAMIGLLAEYADFDDEYVFAWRYLMGLAGLQVLGMYEPDGEFTMSVGGPCDAQMRHRNRYSHFLLEDFDKVPGRRDALCSLLKREGRYADARPRDPRATTAAVRGFLKNAGRIMIDPEGRLHEGGEVPAALMGDDGAARSRCIAANSAYYAVRRRFSAERQIKRAIRMLGRPTANGWIVLGARA